MYKYTEIVEIENNSIASRMDTSNKNDRQLEKLEYSILLRINRELFYVRTIESNEKLECFTIR